MTELLEYPNEEDMTKLANDPRYRAESAEREHGRCLARLQEFKAENARLRAQLVEQAANDYMEREARQ